jgi:hypothetical protein
VLKRLLNLEDVTSLFVHRLTDLALSTQAQYRRARDRHHLQDRTHIPRPTRRRQCRNRLPRRGRRTPRSVVHLTSQFPPLPRPDDIPDNISIATLNSEEAELLAQQAIINQAYLEDLEGRLMQEQVDMGLLDGQLHCFRAELQQIADAEAAHPEEPREAGFDEFKAGLRAKMERTLNQIAEHTVLIQQHKREHRRELQRIRLEEARRGTRGGWFGDAMQTVRDHERLRRQSAEVDLRRHEAFYRFRLPEITPKFPLWWRLIIELWSLGKVN